MTLLDLAQPVRLLDLVVAVHLQDRLDVLGRLTDLARGRRSSGAHVNQSATPHLPQLRFIHRHQSFRIRYTCFELDSVNVSWWIRYV